ncbi:MAG: hypothetical protein ACKPKO_30850, partial [Candidatus Fonsibacter sp.]
LAPICQDFIIKPQIRLNLSQNIEFVHQPKANVHTKFVNVKEEREKRGKEGRRKKKRRRKREQKSENHTAMLFTCHTKITESMRKTKI